MSTPIGAPQEIDERIAKLLESYRPAEHTVDELYRTANSGVTPGWRSVLDAFARMSDAERAAARDKAARLLRDNGVTFVAQGDSDNTDRPWPLDLFPMLIEPREWQAIELGLVQRTRLLNAILGDLYGAQRVLQDGTLPPGIVFGNAQFLRPCRNLGVRDGQYLHFLAFDIARAADGRWWVLSDRTEAPSGAGYALENRVVTSQCLPDVFLNENVRRQASFFRAFSEHMLEMTGREHPLAVFLSRGPSKRTYFEHAYLARYLGYGVVEGSDLTVRDDRLYLKTVEGLRQVDLVLRTIRGELCDPLELRTDSLVGVPGMLQAIRAGSVMVGNAPGSGLVESDAFMSFLPALARYYLGEELAIPSIATWWCGQEREREYVLANLDNLIVRRISSTKSLLSNGKSGRVDNGTNDRKSLRLAIEQRGHDFVGQERLVLSAAPVWSGDSLESAPIVLRVYVAATANGYEVMPGGLTRVSLGHDPISTWLAAGDVSKDTWVLSEEPVETFSLLAQRQENTLVRRGSSELASRAADHLFWLGRYTERAESTVRLLRSLVVRLQGEMGGSRHLVSPRRIVSLLVVQKHMSSRRGKRAVQAGRDAVQRELWQILFDADSKDGLATTLANVRRTAEVVRERLSFDAFRVLKELAELAQGFDRNRRRDTDNALRLLNRLIHYLSAFSGMVMENMTRGYGWRFLDMGRRLERLRDLSQLIQHLAVRGDPQEDGGLDFLLELADSKMTYRGRYRASPQLPRALDLLICDDSNPRSSLFQAVAVGEHLRALPGSGEGALSPYERIATRLAADLRLADVYKLSETSGRFATRVDLARLLKQVEQDVGALSDSIAHRFFSHSAPRRVTGSQPKVAP